MYVGRLDIFAFLRLTLFVFPTLVGNVVLSLCVWRACIRLFMLAVFGLLLSCLCQYLLFSIRKKRAYYVAASVLTTH